MKCFKCRKEATHHFNGKVFCPDHFWREKYLKDKNNLPRLQKAKSAGGEV
ncbi:MAG: hypothetical protein LBC75_02520 [Fibromonadaceae bacterium]|jgi:hypothetical protein|nr:hypothetical protein [Fibromonadaceae bacterium]